MRWRGEYSLMAAILRGLWIKYVKDEIYELRTEYNGNIVVLFNGFQKKTRKTPGNEIERAIKIKKEYYADK